MPSFLMDLACQIESRLGVEKFTALRLAELEIQRLRVDGLAPAAEITAATARAHLQEFLESVPAYNPDGHNGQGIVICAGGHRHFRYAWVCINMLRRMGCILPVELWHFGSYELDEKMADLVRPLGVTTVDALEVRKKRPTRNLLGYAIKPYALLHCAFESVLLLDADNVPVQDVTALFSWPEFSDTGTLFWPDEEPIREKNPIWSLLSLQKPAGPSIESGQVLVDKRRSWRALHGASYLTSHGDFYYRYLRGDRDCFQVAWLYAQTRYRMTPWAMRRLDGAMLQHDFAGRVLFQHRNDVKWDDLSVHVPGFAFEAECVRVLHELDSRWDGSISGRRDGR